MASTCSARRRSHGGDVFSTPDRYRSAGDRPWSHVHRPEPRGIGSDSPRRALAGALIGFARQTGSLVTAAGVETQAELDALQELGVDHTQG